ncbi:MAG: flagellar export protein FliJ [Gammaproteobacteria bacterium]|nr:flagellar export protein FliJ [Gammaproteobacteria bacterium]
MSKPAQLGTIRTLADNVERESSRAVAERRRTLAAEEQRLAQLREYLHEYAELSAAGTGMLVDTVRMRRGFVAKIRAGIEQQERLVAGLREQLDHDLHRWRDARSQSLALEKYQDRLADAANLKEQRRDQARTDEVGQKIYHGT